MTKLIVEIDIGNVSETVFEEVGLLDRKTGEVIVDSTYLKIDEDDDFYRFKLIRVDYI